MLPATNPGLVARVADLARLAGRELATPRDVRDRLGLAQPSGARLG
jgi:hypothetical protein